MSDPDDVDAKLAAITRAAREARPRPSRAMWILAAIIGIACVAAFVLVLVADGEPASATPPDSVGEARGGFAAGLVIGGGVGVAIGYAIARQRHSSRSSP